MKIADILNPSFAPNMLSPPLSPKMDDDKMLHQGKPRSRFSEFEDAIICEGVANGLTWGQISSKLPHRKRATCFNRYRTLQGIRKSRKRVDKSFHHKYTPPSPHSPLSLSPSSSSTTSSWIPTTPPSDLFLSSFPVYASSSSPTSAGPHPPMTTHDSFFRRLSEPTKEIHRLPPIYQHRRHDQYLH